MSPCQLFPVTFSWGCKSRFTSLVTWCVSCDFSIVLQVTYEESAFIVLFLDMRNAVSSHFLTACAVQVSVQCRFSQPREPGWKVTACI